MKVKTSELIGPALDWAVAMCEGGTELFFDGITWGFTLDGKTKVLSKGWAPSMCWCPSSDWAHGGPIIERGLIHTYPRFTAGRTEGGSDVYQQDGWAAYVTPPAFWITPRPFTGPILLIAAMRCYCCAKLGDEVEVPDELVEGP